jgi:hypothetical protein
LNPEKFAFVVGAAVIAGGSLGLILHRLLPEKIVATLPMGGLAPAEEGSCAALPAKQSAKEAQEGDADARKAADKPEPHD